MILPDPSEGEKRPFHFGNTTYYPSSAPRNNALNDNTNTTGRSSLRDYNSQNARQSWRQDDIPYSSNSESSFSSTESSVSVSIVRSISRVVGTHGAEVLLF